MNNYDLDQEFLKSVMEGMGEQPSENMLQNWDTIMNFVPTSAGNNIDVVGNEITITFSDTAGGIKYDIRCSENMQLKDLLYKFGNMARIPAEKINTSNFLCEGTIININTIGTVKSNKIKNGCQIVYANVN